MLEKEEIIKQTYLYNKRKDARLKNRFFTHKHRLLLLGIVIGFAIVCVVYFTLDISKVFKVTVVGNIYYKTKDIIDISGINDDSIYLFTFPSKVEKRFMNDPLIKNVEVSLKNNRLIHIKVAENKIIGYFNQNNEAFLLLENGNRITLDESNLHLISMVPLIQGYTDEQLSEILDGFEDVDNTLLAQMSEIHRYPFSYDENMLQIIMRDGNNVFVSSSGLGLLKNYYTIVSGIADGDSGFCIYLDEVTNSGYRSACPWNKKPVEKPASGTGETE